MKWFLSLFTIFDFRPDFPTPRDRLNRANALWMSVAAGITLLGYEGARSATNVLFKESYSSANLPYVLAAIPLLLYPLLKLYGRSLHLFGPARTLLASAVVSTLLLGGLYLLYRQGIKSAIIPLYLLREGYIVLLIEQYWSFINSSLSSAQAKRLSGVIMAIASIGAVAGGMVVHHYAPIWGTAQLLLMAMVTTLISALPASFAYFKSPVATLQKRHLPPHKDALGLGYLWSEKEIRMIFLMVLFCQFYSVVIYLNFENILQVAYPVADQQASYSGLFYAIVNSLAFGFQFILSPLLLLVMSARSVHILLPLLHLITIALTFIWPGLATISLAFLLFKTTEYSLFRAAKEVLYIPYPEDVRFRTKEFIDIFCHRVSKSTFSFGVAILKQLGILLTVPLAGLLIVASLGGWMAAALSLTKKHAHPQQPTKESI